MSCCCHCYCCPNSSPAHTSRLGAARLLHPARAMPLNRPTPSMRGVAGTLKKTLGTQHAGMVDAWPWQASGRSRTIAALARLQHVVRSPFRPSAPFTHSDPPAPEVWRRPASGRTPTWAHLRICATPRPSGPSVRTPLVDPQSSLLRAGPRDAPTRRLGTTSPLRAARESADCR